MALPPRGLEPVLLHALRAEGAREVRAEGVRVVALFRLDEEVAAGTEGAPGKTGTPGGPGAVGGPGAPGAGEAQLRRRVEARLHSILPPGEGAPRWRPFDGARWLAARGEGAIPLPGHPPLRILPGVAFGEGDHPTTRRCLLLLATRVNEGDRVADVGAGSGILAVAAARLGAAEVLAVEMDPAGCREVEANARANGVEERIRVRCQRAVPADPGLDAAEPATVPRSPAASPDQETGAPGSRGAAPGWNGIVANLEGPILAPLLPALADRLTPGGWLLLSGLLPPEADELPLPGELTLGERHVDEGWVTLLLVRVRG